MMDYINKDFESINMSRQVYKWEVIQKKAKKASELKERCRSLTCEGKKCKLRCTSGNIICSRHLKMCKNYYNRYKRACDKVWKERCLSRTPYQYLEDIIFYSNECKRLRIKYSVKCCGSKLDEGHLGAIEKMDKIANTCEKEIKKRRY